MTQRGRCSLYKPEYRDLASRFCHLGGTNEELAAEDERVRRAPAAHRDWRITCGNCGNCGNPRSGALHG